MGRGRPGTGVDALKTCIRVRFTWQGKRHTETLQLKPTPANIKVVERMMVQIHREIEVDAFDYARHFPGDASAALPSKIKVQDATAGPPRYVTIGKFAELTGHSVAAVHQRLHRRVFVEGREYRRTPDNRIVIDLAAYERWVEGAAAARPPRAS